ncbi:hypothetical protein HMPREF0322_04262 [Desulfitobacterium hafniense DP7]|uniref:Uncharacterized protein n=1 Tax=Desulfitobacterium hafniense DP7 TaxID=537010 RepID=G9XTF5_DESHA|nr:hypothetical protein HMPREF0322_04262 [Desulfitobacterium hafniense DP7]
MDLGLVFVIGKLSYIFLRFCLNFNLCRGLAKKENRFEPDGIETVLVYKLD